jgi:hypothetical protein
MLPSLDDGKRVWDERDVRSVAALFGRWVHCLRVALKHPSRVVLAVDAEEQPGFAVTSRSVTDCLMGARS